MAAINDLINQIDNQELRERIAQEVDRMNRQKKFGLVFEEHLPECTPLYDVPIRKNSTVALKAGKVSDTFVVLKVENGKALCLPKAGGEPAAFDVDDLVAVAEFGEPIYPYLKPIDTICNAPDSGNSARAWPISILPPISNSCTGAASCSKRSRLDAAGRERPTASAAC